MKKIFNIISLCILLCSGVYASENPPPKLFGITLFENMDKNTILSGGDQAVFYDYDQLGEQALTNFAWVEIESEWFKMIKNKNFFKYSVYVKESNEVNDKSLETLGEEINHVAIEGVEAFSKKTFSENDKNIKAVGSCVNFRDNLLELFKAKHDLDTSDFLQSYYIGENKDFLSLVNYNFDYKNQKFSLSLLFKEKLSFNFTCKYFYDEQKNLSSKLWVYLATDDLKKEIFENLNYKITDSNTDKMIKSMTILKGF